MDSDKCKDCLWCTPCESKVNEDYGTCRGGPVQFLSSFAGRFPLVALEEKPCRVFEKRLRPREDGIAAKVRVAEIDAHRRRVDQKR